MKFLVLLLGVCFASTAQLLMKLLSKYEVLSKQWSSYLILSVLFYGLAFLSQIYLYKLFQLNKISPAMSIIIMIIVVIAGTFFFKETITPKHIIGVCLGILSIYLILS